MISDRNVGWIRKREYYTYYDLRSLITRAETGTLTEGQILANPVDTSLAMLEISTLGLVGITFTAAGKLLQGIMKLPTDLDPGYPVGFRVNWSNTGAAAAGRGVTWLLLADAIKKGAVFAAATTALNTVIAESLVTIANGNEWSPRGIKNNLGVTRGDIEDGVNLSIVLEADVVDASVAGVNFLGIELDYAVCACVGSGNEIDNPLSASGL